MKRILIIFVSIIAMIFIYSVITGWITNYRIQKREAYWKLVIDSEIPNGTTKERLIDWLKQRHLNSTWISGQNVFDENVEQISDAGIGFPCGSWDIIIDISLGDNNKTVGRRIHSVGACL
jgi:hypothetical protein